MITSDLPPVTPEPNPIKDAWRQEAEKEACLERKNPVYEISRRAYPQYDSFCAWDDEATKNLGFRPALVAKWLNQNMNFKTDLATGILYFYDGKSWIPNADAYLEVIVSRILGQENKRCYFNDILHDLKGLTYDKIEFSAKIAVKNGLFDVETQTLSDFSEKEMCFHSIPVKYDPAAQCSNWEQFIKQVVNPDDLATIQEWSGFLLLPDYRFHKLLWIHGEGRNGKGVWQRTMEAILGESNVSSVGLEEFDGNHRFALKQLYGKLFNPCSEPNTNRILQTALFKKATGQDTIEAEIKGKQARIQFRNYAKITIPGNKFPQIEDQTVAFKERCLFIKFPNEFKGKDQIQNLEQNWLTINDERSGILNWMLEGLRRLLSQGYFTESKTQQETEIQYLRASDPYNAFIKEQAVFNKNAMTLRSTAFELFKDYCDFIGTSLKKNALDNFTKTLRQTKNVQDSSKRIDGKKQRVWLGITFNPLPDENGTDGTVRPYDLPSANLDQFPDNKQEKTSVPTVPSVPIETHSKRYCHDECKNFDRPSCSIPSGWHSLNQKSEIPLGCPGYRYVADPEEENF